MYIVQINCNLKIILIFRNEYEYELLESSSTLLLYNSNIFTHTKAVLLCKKKRLHPVQIISATICGQFINFLAKTPILQKEKKTYKNKRSISQCFKLGFADVTAPQHQQTIIHLSNHTKRLRILFFSIDRAHVTNYFRSLS